MELDFACFCILSWIIVFTLFWFLSKSQQYVGDVCVLENIFIFIATYPLVILRDLRLLTSSIEKHLGCFHFGACFELCAMSIPLCVSCIVDMGKRVAWLSGTWSCDITSNEHHFLLCPETALTLFLCIWEPMTQGQTLWYERWVWPKCFWVEWECQSHFCGSKQTPHEISEADGLQYL